MNACTFCGHADAGEEILPALKDAIFEMITGGVDCFYVGSNGSFDRMALLLLREFKKQYPNIIYHVMLSYMPGKKEAYSFYGEVETLYPDGLEGVPLRYAIVHRNRWMVEHSQHIIAYVTHGWGGAAATLKAAQNRKLQIKQIFSTK